MSKFSKKVFTTTAEYKTRDNRDNKFFKEIQVKTTDDIITDDCQLIVDSDTIAFSAAQVQEEAYVIVTNKDTNWTKEFKTKTDFKGAARTGGFIYKVDSDRAALESCTAKLERDRYCVMIAVPSEYKLSLGDKDGF